MVQDLTRSLGGGTVLLWDRGTWEPLENPHEGLRKGSLKFAMHGEKLQGKWTLVRIKGRDLRVEPCVASPRLVRIAEQHRARRGL